MRGDNACRHHRGDQVALATGPRPEQGFEPQALHGHMHRLHMAVRARGNDLELLGNRAYRFAAQHRAKDGDLSLGERGQIGKGALAHLRPFAVGLAQQIRRARAAIGDRIDVHDYILQHIYRK